MESITQRESGRARRDIVLVAALSLIIVLVVTSCAGGWLKPHSNEQYLHGHSWRNGASSQYSTSTAYTISIITINSSRTMHFFLSSLSSSRS